MTKIRYGIIGCGKHALHSHAIPGKEIGDLALVALYDVSPQQMIQFEAEFGTPLDKYTNLESFLQSDLDAVFIGSPDEFHFSNLSDAINYDKHAFVEKPLATTVEEVERLPSLLSQAKENDLVVSSCHPRRYDPPFMWLSENIADWKSQLGDPKTFHFDFSYHKPSKQWKHNRGLLLDHLNHEIDLLHYLFGHKEFEAYKLEDGFDAYHVVGRRKDQLAFNFEGTRRLNARAYPEFARIRFARGEVHLDCHRGIAQIHDHDQNIVESLSVPTTDYSLRGKRTLENFVQAIKGLDPCYLTHDDLYINTAMSVYLTHRDKWGRGDK